MNVPQDTETETEVGKLMVHDDVVSPAAYVKDDRVTGDGLDPNLVTFKKRNIKIFAVGLVLLVVLAIVLGILAATDVIGEDDSEDESFDSMDSIDEQELQEFESIDFFLELNDSDNDLGVQLKLGSDPWKQLVIQNPNGDTILNVNAKGSLQEYGMSDLHFESAEPEFATDETALDEDGMPLPSKAEILERFPSGEYTFMGYSTDGDPMHGTARLTHDLPEAVVITAPQDNATVAGTQDLAVTWDAVVLPATTRLHSYEVIVTNTEDEDFSLDMRFPGTSTSATVPMGFLESGVKYELEILARETSGNQVITIHFFTVE